MENFCPETDDERVSGQEDRVVGAHQARRHLIAHVLKMDHGLMKSMPISVAFVSIRCKERKWLYHFLN